MKNSDEKIEELLLQSQWRKVIELLIDIVRSDEATFHDYAAFIDAVSSGEFSDCYEIAFDCFMKANKFKDANTTILRGLYLRIEPIIKFLGLRYFDDNNTNQIPKDFYLRARFMLFINSGKMINALNTITQLIKESETAAYYFQRSKIYIFQKQYKLALKDLDEAINMTLTDSTLYYHRALLKQKIHDVQGALYDFDSAINYSPKNHNYYFARGLFNEDLGHYKNALEDFKKTVQLNPENVKAFQEIAWCKYKMEASDEALSFINIAIQLDLKNCSSYYIRGCIHNALKRYDNALADLQTAIVTDNQTNRAWSARIWHQKSWAEFKLNKYKDAQADIIEAIKLNERNISFYFLAMDIEFFGLKDFHTAKGYAKTILKLEPDNQRAMNAIKVINDNLSF